MFWSFLGIIIGLMLGYLFAFNIPAEYARYTAVILLGMFDAIFGAFRADVTHDHFSTWIFLSGVIFNILLAVGITALGDQLGLDLYLAATVVFTFRIFSNLGTVRRYLMQQWFEKKHSNIVHLTPPQD